MYNDVHQNVNIYILVTLKIIWKSMCAFKPEWKYSISLYVGHTPAQRKCIRSCIRGRHNYIHSTHMIHGILCLRWWMLLGLCIHTHTFAQAQYSQTQIGVSFHISAEQGHARFSRITQLLQSLMAAKSTNSSSQQITANTETTTMSRYSFVHTHARKLPFLALSSCVVCSSFYKLHYVK